MFQALWRIDYRLPSAAKLACIMGCASRTGQAPYRPSTERADAAASIAPHANRVELFGRRRAALDRLQRKQWAVPASGWPLLRVAVEHNIAARRWVEQQR